MKPFNKLGYKWLLDAFYRGTRSTYFSSSENALEVHQCLLDNKYEALIRYRANNFFEMDETEIEMIGHLN